MRRVSLGRFTRMFALIGLMAAGVYTVARSAVTDWITAILAAGAGIILAKRWLPAAAAVLAAGALGWLLGL